MTDLLPPNCRIYVDADMAETELIGLVGELVFAGDGAAEVEVDILHNEDFDSNRRRNFPGGFVYFRYYMDLYTGALSRRQSAVLVTRVLQGLWDWGVPAVAACDFEDWLPHSGGYRSQSVPWPG